MHPDTEGEGQGGLGEVRDGSGYRLFASAASWFSFCASHHCRKRLWPRDTSDTEGLEVMRGGWRLRTGLFAEARDRAFPHSDISPDPPSPSPRHHAGWCVKLRAMSPHHDLVHFEITYQQWWWASSRRHWLISTVRGFRVSAYQIVQFYRENATTWSRLIEFYNWEMLCNHFRGGFTDSTRQTYRRWCNQCSTL